MVYSNSSSNISVQFQFSKWFPTDLKSGPLIRRGVVIDVGALEPQSQPQPQ